VRVSLVARRFTSGPQAISSLLLYDHFRPSWQI
jgi:hypothetical protein